ncbi:hypothetical protein BS78_08G161800 [Paspalum vaginatum]|nr:hypothetical protein BS78_08G161800 [Paspalum vaginatum]
MSLRPTISVLGNLATFLSLLVGKDLVFGIIVRRWFHECSLLGQGLLGYECLATDEETHRSGHGRRRTIGSTHRSGRGCGRRTGEDRRLACVSILCSSVGHTDVGAGREA